MIDWLSGGYLPQSAYKVIGSYGGADASICASDAEEIEVAAVVGDVIGSGIGIGIDISATGIGIGIT